MPSPVGKHWEDNRVHAAPDTTLWKKMTQRSFIRIKFESSRISFYSRICQRKRKEIIKKKRWNWATYNRNAQKINPRSHFPIFSTLQLPKFAHPSSLWYFAIPFSCPKNMFSKEKVKTSSWKRQKSPSTSRKTYKIRSTFRKTPPFSPRSHNYASCLFLA